MPQTSLMAAGVGAVVVAAALAAGRIPGGSMLAPAVMAVLELPVYIFGRLMPLEWNPVTAILFLWVFWSLVAAVVLVSAARVRSLLASRADA